MLRAFTHVCRGLIAISMLGLAGSAVAHGLTVAGVLPVGWFLKLLYGGAASVGTAVTLVAFRVYWRYRGWSWWQAASNRSPWWPTCLTLASLAYAIVNFMMVYRTFDVASLNRVQRATQAARVGTGHMMAAYSAGIAGLHLLLNAARNELGTKD
jgi:hypothetical protein